MWTLWRLLGVPPWILDATYEAILRTAGYELLQERKVFYIGHILRLRKYYIPKLILQGKIKGRQSQGTKQPKGLV